MSFIQYNDPTLYEQSVDVALDVLYAHLAEQVKLMGLPEPRWVLAVGEESLRVALIRNTKITSPVYVVEGIPDNEICVIEEHDLRLPGVVEKMQ